MQSKFTDWFGMATFDATGLWDISQDAILFIGSMTNHNMNITMMSVIAIFLVIMITSHIQIGLSMNYSLQLVQSLGNWQKHQVHPLYLGSRRTGPYHQEYLQHSTTMNTCSMIKVMRKLRHGLWNGSTWRCIWRSCSMGIQGANYSTMFNVMNYSLTGIKEWSI